MSQIAKKSAGGGGGGGIETIAGDIGVITGPNVTIYANHATNNSGSSVLFNNSGTISTLNLTDANFNTVLGRGAGNLTGTFNTSTIVGALAGSALTSASGSVFVGVAAGQSCTSGINNTYIGNSCADSTTTGSNNVAVGLSALSAYTSGPSNTGSNVAVGSGSLSIITTGINNIALGATAGNAHTLADSSNIDIGNRGVAGNSNTIRIGTQGTGIGQQNRCFVAGVTGITVANQQVVTIDSTTGQLGVTAPVNFQAYRTSNQSIAGGSTAATIIFDSVTANVGSGYNIASGIFTAPSTGFYSFATTVYFTSLNGPVGITQILLAYTGSVQSLRLVDTSFAVASGGVNYICTAAWKMPMTAGDTVKIQPFTDGAGNYNISGAALTSAPFNTISTFSGCKII